MVKVFKSTKKPVHSLLFVKSIPTIRFEDSRPAFERASVTCIIKVEWLKYCQENQFNRQTKICKVNLGFVIVFIQVYWSVKV